MTQTETLLPLGIAALPADCRACESCGAPTVHDAHEVTLYGLPEPATFGVCESCTERRDLASAIVAANPGVVRFGSPRIVADRLRVALTAIAAAGQTPPPIDAWSLAMIGAALDRLSEFTAPGFAGFTWLSMFAPAKTVDGLGATRYEKSSRDPARTCASTPWMFIDGETAAELRFQVAQWLVDQREPRPIPHPTEAGCAACGIATSPGRRSAEAWHPITAREHRGLLLCTTCAKYDGDGNTFRLTLAAMILDHLDPDGDLRRRWFSVPDFSDLQMWVDSGYPPAAEPWAHLDLSGVREYLTHGTGAGQTGMVVDPAAMQPLLVAMPSAHPARMTTTRTARPHTRGR